MKACPFCAQDIEDAAIVCDHCHPDTDGPTAAGSRRGWRIALTMATISVLAVLALSGTTLLKARATQPAPNAAANVPVTLTNRIEHLPPDSWKAVPLNVPHDGVLEVEVGVTRGNPVNVFVTTPAEMQRMLGDDLTTVQQYPGFDATMTKRFVREGELTAGNYYLVVHDPSVSRTSASTSDVSIQVNLRR